MTWHDLRRKERREGMWRGQKRKVEDRRKGKGIDW